MRRLPAAIAFAAAMLLPWTPAVHAQSRLTAYRCVDRAGHVSYQDTPCPPQAKQHRLELTVPPPPTTTPAPAPVPSSPTTPPVPQPEAPTPRAGVPALYACERATDGKHYVSRNGHPPAYRVPLNMLGWDSPALSESYGSQSDPRPSASEFDRSGKVMSRLVGGPYTWVRDRCRRMSVEETCHRLRNEYEDLEQKIHDAFESDRPPLEKRARRLKNDLSGC